MIKEFKKGDARAVLNDTSYILFNGSKEVGVVNLTNVLINEIDGINEIALKNLSVLINDAFNQLKTHI